MVVALDLVFLGLLSLQFESALLLAMAVGGWVYFPLRQVVWRRLSDGTRARTGDLLPDILALTSHTAGDSLLRRKDWLALWDRAFSPLSVHETRDAPDVPQVDPQGRCLTVPGGEGLPALVLTLAGRGQRLFRPDDARRAAEIVRLVRTGLASHQSFEQGARQERQRIASDLHDDLGATLLSIAQTSAAGPASTLARQAIEELRLSVRGLTGDAAPLADALADWRAETVSRLMAASIEVLWDAEGTPDDVHIPASLRTQVTRILREAVSNVIRHSGARHCRINLTLQAGVLRLDVNDEGRGVAGAADGAVSRQARGMGLANMERRAHKLGGHYVLATSAMGGVHVQVRVPLDQSATIAAT
jgi:signal transduction histidine kinase